MAGMMPAAGGDPHATSASERAREALVDELYLRSRVALGTFALALPLVWLLLGRAGRSASVRATFGVLVAVTPARLATLWWPGPPRDARRRERAFSLGAGTTGLLLGTLNVLAFPHLSPGRIDLLTVFHAGLMSGALMNIGVRPWIYVLHFVPTMGSLAVLLAGDTGRWESGILCLMVVVYAPALCLMSVQHSKSRTQAILLGLDFERLALHDGLTGLPNRRYVSTFMEKESARVMRAWSAQGRGGGEPHSLAVILVDLDLFKAVNDTHGHPAGDAVLIQVARILQACVRDSDLVARWGGEEFLILARDSERRHPSRVAARIQRRVRAAVVSLPGGKAHRMTCSIGSALYPFSTRLPRAMTWEGVLALADAGLYRAKGAGRDRIGSVFEGHTTVPVTEEELAALAARVDDAERRGLLQIDLDQGDETPEADVRVQRRLA